MVKYEILQVEEGDRMGGQEDSYRSLGYIMDSEEGARLFYNKLCEKHPREPWVHIELHQVLEVQPYPS